MQFVRGVGVVVGLGGEVSGLSNMFDEGLKKGFGVANAADAMSAFRAEMVDVVNVVPGIPERCPCVNRVGQGRVFGQAFNLTIKVRQGFGGNQIRMGDDDRMSAGQPRFWLTKQASG